MAASAIASTPTSDPASTPTPDPASTPTPDPASAMITAVSDILQKIKTLLDDRFRLPITVFELLCVFAGMLWMNSKVCLLCGEDECGKKFADDASASFGKCFNERCSGRRYQLCKNVLFGDSPISVCSRKHTCATVKHLPFIRPEIWQLILRMLVEYCSLDVGTYWVLEVHPALDDFFDKCKYPKMDEKLAITELELKVIISHILAKLHGKVESQKKEWLSLPEYRPEYKSKALTELELRMKLYNNEKEILAILAKIVADLPTRVSSCACCRKT
jgi:hypothetical protein